MATKTKDADAAEATAANSEAEEASDNSETEEDADSKRGRKAEPFGHSFDPFSLTVSFHDGIDEAAAGSIISGILEQLHSAAESATFAIKRVTRGEPSFYRQTFKVAPEDYDWPEQREKVERGKRISPELNAALAQFVQSILGVDDLAAYAKRTGKTVDAVIAETVKRVQETSAAKQ